MCVCVWRASCMLSLTCARLIKHFPRSSILFAFFRLTAVSLSLSLWMVRWFSRKHWQRRRQKAINTLQIHHHSAATHEFLLHVLQQNDETNKNGSQIIHLHWFPVCIRSFVSDTRAQISAYTLTLHYYWLRNINDPSRLEFLLANLRLGWRWCSFDRFLLSTYIRNTCVSGSSSLAPHTD